VAGDVVAAARQAGFLSYIAGRTSGSGADGLAGYFPIASVLRAWYLANMMQFAIIGAGPSGFFVTAEIMKRFPGAPVSMFEKRVFPSGLVRFGVSPDHQATRRAAGTFDQIAAQPGFHYYGHVDAVKVPGLEALRRHFHAIVVCTGAEVPSLPDVPGIDSRRVIAGIDLARWTNGEEHAINPRVFDGVETAVIVGNGNVALDAARMLARPAVDWVKTDIAPHAMEVLMHHRLNKIIIAGRRGPADVSFTEAEFEELVSLPGWDVRGTQGLPFAKMPEKPASNRCIEFRFYQRIARIREQQAGCEVEFSVANQPNVNMAAQLVICATGQRGVPFGDLPFDTVRGVIPNDRGRVHAAPGFYVCGWIKRGANGVIGVNKKDAIETVARIVEDMDILAAKHVTPFAMPETEDRVITWADWKKIEAMEIGRGGEAGRPRLNFSESEALRALSV